MKNRRPIILSALAASAILAGNSAHAALFADTFDVDTSAAWTVNALRPGPDRAIFSYDYSAVGIPSAPNSLGGTTRGLKLQANRSGSVFSGLSVSPLGGNFIGDYVVKFDLWQNYNGPLGPSPAGGNGTTQLTGAGIGTAGITPQWVGSAVYDSLFFAQTPDGGSGTDYRVYPVANAATAASGYYAAGTGTSPDARNNSHPYYADFGGEAAPAGQLSQYAGQTGTTPAGALAFAWHEVEITKDGSIVTYVIDDKLIATVDTSTLTLGGNNILFNYSDSNGTSSTDPLADDLLFGLIDNVTVTPVPEPATYATIFGLLALGAGIIRRRKNAA